MRRIAYLAGNLPKASETFVYREVLGLRERGWEVHAFTLRPTAMEDLPAGLEGVDATPVYDGTLWPRPTWDVVRAGEATSVGGRVKAGFQKAAGVRLAGMMRERGVTHVHAHFAHAPTSVAMYAARALAGGSFSFTGHANDLFQRRHLLALKLRRAAFVACISRWHRGFYEGIEPGGRYEVVRCGVDVGAAPGPRDFSGRVMTLCRLVAKKGVDTLIEGLPAGMSLTVAGDGPERGRLEALAEGKAVTFLGAVDHARGLALMREHDVFALPCREDGGGDRDGIPVALMEAMAAGLPVVAGDLPAIRELVEDGRTGRLVDGADPSAVGEALENLRDDAERHKIAAAGHAHVAREFATSANLDRLEKALAGCV